ncbi:MAG: hypothetical protein U0165_18165 [Polyangiaceae bacterium]
MLNENVSQRRQEWGFNYKGKELLPYAERKLNHHQAEERQLRATMAVMIQDPATFHDDQKLQQVKRDIDRHSALREQFQVYCHEFARTPNLEFRLGLSDVIFFGLLEPIHTDGVSTTTAS